MPRCSSSSSSSSSSCRRNNRRNNRNGNENGNNNRNNNRNNNDNNSVNLNPCCPRVERADPIEKIFETTLAPEQAVLDINGSFVPLSTNVSVTGLSNVPAIYGRFVIQFARDLSRARYKLSIFPQASTGIINASGIVTPFGTGLTGALNVAAGGFANINTLLNSISQINLHTARPSEIGPAVVNIFNSSTSSLTGFNGSFNPLFVNDQFGVAGATPGVIGNVAIPGVTSPAGVGNAFQNANGIIGGCHNQINNSSIVVAQGVITNSTIRQVSSPEGNLFNTVASLLDGIRVGEIYVAISVNLSSTSTAFINISRGQLFARETGGA